MKPGLSFYTNMPTPYQLDFFNELKELFDLEVIYFTEREQDRVWNLPVAESGYRSRVLNNSRIAKIVQRKIVSFHFSWKIFNVILKDSSKFFIVNGTYWSPNVVITLILGRLRRKKVLFFGETVFPDTNKWVTFLKKYILMLPLKATANGLLAIGETAAASYKNLGFKKRVVNIPYNINIDVFDKKNLNTTLLSDCYQKWKPNSELVLLSSGSLIERKGIDTLIRAFLPLSAKYDAKLIIIGDGPKRTEYEMMAGETKNVFFLGFIDKQMVPYYFNVADIFVFASRYDGWGLVINEAVAADLPIISSVQTAAAREVIIHGQNGFLCDAANVECFSKHMDLLMHNAVLREKMGRQAHTIKNKLSSKSKAREVYEFCQSFK